MIDKARSAMLDAYPEFEDRLPPDEIERRREAFLAKYSSELLIALSESELLAAVHGDVPRSGLFYDLEFGDPYTVLGSVGGGSSLKFKVYAAADGSGYKKKGQGNVPVPCSELEAARMTSDIVASLHKALLAAEEYRLSDGDLELWRKFEQAVTSDVPPSLAQVGNDSAVTLLGWAHKYLAISRPDLFSFHHQSRQLASHLVRLGETPIDGDSRYLLDYQWRELRTKDEELRRRDPLLLMQAAYKAFGADTKYWRVGTDEGQIDRWPEMQNGGFASVGWAALGNLKDLLAGLEGTQARDRLREVLASNEYYGQKTPQTIGRWASQIHDFYTTISPGDRIVAMKGQQILGVGEVTGDYGFASGDIQPHHRQVRWHDAPAQAWPNSPGLQTTLYNFSKRYADAVHVEELLLASVPIPSSPTDIAVPVAPPVAPQLPLLDAVPLTELEQRIKDNLNRKGQVILYGPPGTGKTYHARQTARELVTREICGGRAWAMIGGEERRAVDASVEFITFHPAYAYEDFIEGYRPAPPENGAPASFELRDGVFLEICDRARQDPTRHRILLIDEINRGNVAAIMGELITLLESDKRDNIAATLPLSRRAFRIPKNVWLIGTMNTADRSVSLLDAALRRRFGFVELLPEPERIAVDIEGLSLAALLTEINARIRKHVTRNARELQVGHAYLMRGGQPLHSKEDLLAAFRDDILPLLAEYCFENYATLARIVGDEIIDVAGQIPNASVLSNAHSLHKALRRLVSADPARVTDLDDAEGEAGENTETAAVAAAEQIDENDDSDDVGDEAQIDG